MVPFGKRGNTLVPGGIQMTINRIYAGIAGITLTAGLAVGLTAGRAAATAPVYGPGMYLFTGNGDKIPMRLSGGIPVYPHWTVSPVPDEIRTTPVTLDGVKYDYGTIMVGSGPLPAKYGNSDYPNWWWHLGPGYGSPAVQLAYADLTVKNALIQNVVGEFLGGSQVGPGGFTKNFEVLNGGGITTFCLSYVIPGQYYPLWLHLDSAYDWVPDATAGC